MPTTNAVSLMGGCHHPMSVRSALLTGNGFAGADGRAVSTLASSAAWGSVAGAVACVVARGATEPDALVAASTPAIATAARASRVRSNSAHHDPRSDRRDAVRVEREQHV